MTIEELYAHFRRHPQVTTDSRRCPKGGIFFALKGDNFNGNAYAQKALDAGCSLAIVDEAQYATSPQTILVDDALATLQALAHHHRQQLQEKFFLQITGTNGKTTTKELVAAVLSRSGDVQYTQGNLNNHIGVPLTILSLQPGPGYAIIETGANHPGEIQQLTNIVDPDWGLVTNVGRAHLEGFGSYEGVCRTKGELYDYLRQHNKIGIFLNKSAERLTEMAHDLPAVTYGLTTAKGADVTGEVIECNPFVRFRYRQDGRPWQTVQTRLIGDYNIHNLMAAVCVGIEFMVPYSEINDALATYEPHLKRSEYHDTGRNHLLLDAYNANPSSMQVALDNFERITAPRKMVILGDMRELGPDSQAEHQRIANRLAPYDQAWLIGPEFAKTEAPSHVRHFPNVEAATAEAHTLKDHTILIKGSNGTRLWLLADNL